MSFNLDDVQVGGQLRVGVGLVGPIKEGEYKINGSMHAEGPVVFGGPEEFDDNVATLMVGRTKNDDKDCVPADRSLYVKGNTYMEGDEDTDNALYVSGGKGGGTGENNSVYIDGDLYVSGDIDGGNKGRLATRFGTADSLGKVFDMVHPTKGQGWRLAHACIEGPEVGVYFRGRLRRGKEIFLPKYWKGLVHTNSISVQLQPIGAHQDIIVKRWDDDKIYLQAMGGMPIDCFYHVYGERKDINPLHVEYEGETWEDYPDPNHRNFDPLDPKRNLLDDTYRGSRNTITM
tara:strand:+ start:331 stop:1194 length:864 start_codon:yes stop_codon:yes gene_type:complete